MRIDSNDKKDGFSGGSGVEYLLAKYYNDIIHDNVFNEERIMRPKEVGMQDKFFFFFVRGHILSYLLHPQGQVCFSTVAS